MSEKKNQLRSQQVGQISLVAIIITIRMDLIINKPKYPQLQRSPRQMSHPLQLKNHRLHHNHNRIHPLKVKLQHRILRAQKIQFLQLVPRLYQSIIPILFHQHSHQIQPKLRHLKLQNNKARHQLLSQHKLIHQLPNLRQAIVSNHSHQFLILKNHQDLQQLLLSHHNQPHQCHNLLNQVI